MHIVIVEDEPLIARRLERLTREALGGELEKVECRLNLDLAIESLRHSEATILLLDLNLSGQDGFEILHRAMAQACLTIVVSANTDRAMEAFELGVADFVPKPFTGERLAKAFERVKQSRTAGRRFLAVSIAGNIDLIPLDSVIAVHGEDDYSGVETLDGRKHLHRKTLTALEQQLPENFRRVHRSHIVNVQHVRRVVTQPSGSKVIAMTNGATIPVGRSYFKALVDGLI